MMGIVRRRNYMGMTGISGLSGMVSGDPAAPPDLPDEDGGFFALGFFTSGFYPVGMWA